MLKERKWNIESECPDEKILQKHKNRTERFRALNWGSIWTRSISSRPNPISYFTFASVFVCFIIKALPSLRRCTVLKGN